MNSNPFPTGLTLGDAVLCRQQPLLHQTLQHRAHRRTMNQLQDKQVRLQREGGGIFISQSEGRCLFDVNAEGCRVRSYAAAGGHGDLDGVPARLTHLLQVQRLVGSFVVASFDGERSRVHAHLQRRQTGE